jgi:hypothetical protein
MRLVGPLICLAACSFPSPKFGDDTEPVEEWTVIEEMSVRTDGTVITSVMALERDVDYQLRASGTYYFFFVKDQKGDAEFHAFNVASPVDGESGIDVGLAIDDTVVDSVRTPRWGPYNDAHVYQVDWRGEGRQITAQLHDGNYDNNVGTLTLEILALR